MEELIALVVEKTGISEAQATTAVDTVMGYLKKKLPAPVAGQVEAVLSSAEGVARAEQVLDKGIKGLGGLLKKK